MPRDARLLFTSDKYITFYEDSDKEGNIDWYGFFKDYDPTTHRMDIVDADSVLHFAEQFST